MTETDREREPVEEYLAGYAEILTDVCAGGPQAHP